MDVRRGVKASCAQCGGPLSSASGACKRCGAIAVPEDSQYGLLDLGGGSEGGGSIALDTAVDPAAPRRAQRAAATVQQGPRGAAGGRAAGRTLADGTARSVSSSRNAAVDPRHTGASSARNPAVTTGAHPRSPEAGRAALNGHGGAPARAGKQPARVQTADGLPDSVVDPSAMPYGRGVMLGEDPFNQAFSTGGAALDLVEAESEPEEEAAPAAPVETPEQQRAREIAALAGYGPRPANIAAEPAYWLRVMLRKRALDAELLALSAQRKRADDATTDALASMGQALHALAHDERLAKLRKQLSAVSDAGSRIGDVEAAGERRKQDVNQELARLDRELAKLEQQASPLRAREAALVAEIEQLEGALKRAELLRRKTEGELEVLQKKGGHVETWAALKAERDARHGEVQSLGVQMRPLQDDLAIVRKELAQQLRAIAVVQGEKQGAATALERAQQNHRLNSGSARGALQQALVSLANAAFKHGLEALVAEQAQAVAETRERARQKRASEELLRTAAGSFDQAAYSRGMMILLGGSGLFLLSLIIAIIF